MLIIDGCVLLYLFCYFHVDSSTQTYFEEINTQPTHKKNMTYKEIPEPGNELHIHVIVICVTVIVTILSISAGVLFCFYKRRGKFL